MIEREVGLQVLDADATACTLVFVPADPGDGMYQPLSALAVLAGLNGCGFTGVAASANSARNNIGLCP